MRLQIVLVLEHMQKHRDVEQCSTVAIGHTCIDVMPHPYTSGSSLHEFFDCLTGKLLLYPAQCVTSIDVNDIEPQVL